MSVGNQQLIVYHAAGIPEADSTGTVGGDIHASFYRPEFADLDVTGLVEVVSSSASDSAIDVVVYTRRAGGAIQNETIQTSGTTPVPGALTCERLMKATTAGAPVGWIALMAVDNTTTGTCPSAGTTNTIVLASTASDDDDAYNNYVIRITAGTGQYQIRRIIDYDGGTETATVWDWDVTPDGTTVYEIAPGMVLDLEPYQCKGVVRCFYDAAAPAAGAANIVRYWKCHVRNCNNESPPKDFTNAKLAEVAGGLAAKVSFAIEDAVDDTNDAATRITEPTDNGSWITDTTATALQNGGILEPIMDQGFWLQLTLASTDTATNSQWNFSFTGQST